MQLDGKAKTCSAEDAVKVINSNNRVFIQGMAGMLTILYCEILTIA
jgi:hypothetical protein